MKTRMIGATALVAALSGCASIVSGVSQPVSVETRLNGEPVAGVACKLSSNKGTWFVTTPGQLILHRGYQDLEIACEKPGITPSVSVAQSHVRALYFGNLLFGGVIGFIVDLGDGAGFDYDDLISIEMGRSPAVGGLVPSISTPIETPVVTVATPVVPGGVPIPPAVPSTPASVQATGPVDRIPATTPAQLQSAGPVAATTASGTSRREHRYQVSAESFAKTQSCAAMPVGTMNAYGPGFETYAVPCDSGDILFVRCEFGNCRALR